MFLIFIIQDAGLSNYFEFELPVWRRSDNPNDKNINFGGKTWVTNFDFSITDWVLIFLKSFD